MSAVSLHRYKKEPMLRGFCAVNRSLSHQCVSVHEHTLAVLRERPAVQFGERHPQVRTLHQGQVSQIAWIHHVHHMHLIKNGAQHISIKQTVWFTSARMSPLILREWLNSWCRYLQGSATCSPTRATSFLVVLWLRNDWPRTIAPFA